jgi:hypothetical protein
MKHHETSRTQALGVSLMNSNNKERMIVKMTAIYLKQASRGWKRPLTPRKQTSNCDDTCKKG